MVEERLKLTTDDLEQPETSRFLLFHPKGKSKVWKYIGFRTNGSEIIDKKKLTCHLCSTVITYSGNITNQMYHLQKEHMQQYREMKEMKEQEESTTSKEAYL